LKNIPINIEENVILKNLKIKILLKLNNLSFFKKINKTHTLNHEETVVAIGIIIKPIESKKERLIIIFNATVITPI